MRRVFVMLSAVAALTAGSMGMANAVEFHIGPGGVYVGHHHRYYYDYRNCRTVIRHRINRFGDRVTVRRRTCY